MNLTRAAALAVPAAVILLTGCGDPSTAPESAPLSPAAAALAVAPAAPTALSTTAFSYSAITLAWTDNSSDESGFEVWRSTTGPTGSYALRKTLAANASTHKDTGLTPGRQACYKVRAKDATGTSPSGFTNISCAITPLRPPANLVATVTGPATISLAFTDNNTTELGFEVWRSSSGISGGYSLVTTLAANSTGWDDAGRTPGKEYCYKLRAVGADTIPPSKYSNKSCATIPAPLSVRIVLFGDSNTDRCEEVAPPNRLSSYVSVAPRLSPTDAPLACSVAGKVDAAWKGVRAEPIGVVNHAIASSTTGGGGFGGPNRTSQGAPNARTAVNGVRRFQAEALGKGYPWSGGEPTNSSFPTGPIQRVNAFVPGTNDFVYVSMGTNDDAGPTRTMTVAETEANLRWMIQQWTAAGRAADHFFLTTLAPRDDANSATSISGRNTMIRALAGELGVHLVDLAAFTSDDNGATWRGPTLHTGDGIHYTEAVRAWLADQIAGWMSSKAPPA